MQNNLKRGDFVVADGRVRIRKYVNNEGKNISTTDIVIDSILTPGSRKLASGYTQPIPSVELENIDEAFPDTADVDLNLDDAFSVKEVETDPKPTEKTKAKKVNLPWEDDLED